MKSWMIPFFGVSLMAGIGWSTVDVAPLVNPPLRRERSDLGDSSITGQIQTSASGWLWVYTEEYLHNGIKLRRMTETEKKQAGLDDGRNHGIPIIPPASQDFRSVFGDVERAVNAWTPDLNHRQNDPRQSMPLFRLMTWLDPQFVEGWTTGASVIGMDRTEDATEKAMQFLREGLQHNPDCVDIPMMFGMLEVTRRSKLREGEGFFKRAIQNGRARFETLSENEMSALQSSYRWLALVYRNSGQSGKLMKVTEEGLRLFPDDRVLPLTSRPSIVPSRTYKQPVGIRSRVVP